MKGTRTLAMVALAFSLALGACAGSDTTQPVVDDDYEFPAELVAAGETLAMAPPVNVVAPAMTEADEPVTPPPPRAVQEALTERPPLPLPSLDLLPDIERLEPFIVTDDGERRLLREVSVSVSYDPDAGLLVEPAGWWVVNYPLDRIRGAEGQSLDDVARMLTGHPYSHLTNYYFYTAPSGSESVPAPASSTGPVPIKVTAGPDLVVNNQDPGASDDNDGSLAQPLETISAAIDRAVPGTVVHVYPGTYRESVVIDVDGTSDAPIRIEGIRGASGAMPVITGNDVFASGAWSAVDGRSGVYVADAFTDLSGSLVVDGDRFVERGAPWDLAGGEYTVSGGGEAFVTPRFDGDTNGRDGAVYDFGSSQYIWQPLQADSGGFIDLGSEFGEDFAGGVYWGSTWVYVRKPAEVSDYSWYHDKTGFDLQVSGPFRSGGISGETISTQPYEYRVWLDGELLDTHVFATSSNGEADIAHPELGLGTYGETWHGLVMDEGWHHLVFQWDTTTASGSADAVPVFRFGIPEIVGTARTSASKPSSSRYIPSGDAESYVSEYMVIGPVPSSYSPSVFVRLPGNADPNESSIEIAARSGPVVSILGDYVEVHGFEVGGGSQYEGEALISIGRRGTDPGDDVYVQGAVVEGNLVSGSQYTGIGAAVSGDMAVGAIEISNNWVIDSGAVGISVSGTSDKLTETTVDDWAPGRTPATVTMNRVVNSGWAGYDRIADVSGILVERMTATTISYNTVIGGGPGITLRGENYGVRVDGNVVTDPYAWGIGVEANPGPNVVSNNLITGLRIGPEWMKAGILTWDSDQTWIINNTVDGMWSVETGWFGDVGTWGAGGSENFPRMDYSAWELQDFRRWYVNNLLLGNYLGGIEDYLGNWGESDTFTANYREIPSPDPFDYFDDGAERADVRYDFVDRDGGDYRLRDGSELDTLGAINLTARLAVLDLLGLPRFVDDTASVGAYRGVAAVPAGSSVIEVLFTDGSVAHYEG